ncbi:ATP-binding response regulator [Vibrio ponticus]|uniref:ATP-binding response regulator n=1 Tax=Vibrio ponticus TaxID=265668 RepID=UPI00160C25FE|nr:ATP-binding protein [Vibrio ponticus]
MPKTLKQKPQQQHQHALLPKIVECFPGMVAVIDAKQQVVISNHLFDQCFDRCNTNGCLESSQSCSLLDVLFNIQNDSQSVTFSIEKPRCPLNKRHYQVHHHRLFDQDELLSYQLFMFTDCTQLKKQEVQLHNSNQQALSALRARDNFLATISHELRTPLSAIIGLLELLKPDLVSDVNRELFSSAQASASQLNLLVSDILDLSKIEANQMHLDIIESNIFYELSPPLKTFEALAKNKELEFVVNWHPSINAIAKLDWLRVTQILNNLLSNAIKFTEFGSVLVTVRHDSNQLLITVRDSGCGMTNEQMINIYQPFTQADATISRKFGGTGLGLSIVKNLIELMDGDIELESTPGVGSLIKITIPAQFKPLILPNNNASFATNNNDFLNQWLKAFNLKSDSPFPGEGLTIATNEKNLYPDSILTYLYQSSTLPAIPGQFVAPSCQACFVLVADDDPINCLLFKKQLNKLGINHHCVSDGSDAYQYLIKHKASVSLLITDCHMPIMNGYDLTASLRQNADFVGLPIIGCTAEDSRIAADRAKSSGMNDVLYKPYTLESLSQMITLYCCTKASIQNSSLPESQTIGTNVDRVDSMCACTPKQNNPNV